MAPKGKTAQREAGAAQENHIASESGSKGSMVCADGAFVLSKYSRGVTRVSLDMLGVSKLNRGGRPLSGKRGHTLMRRIIEK